VQPVQPPQCTYTDWEKAQGSEGREFGLSITLIMHLSYHSSSAPDHPKPVIARLLCPTPALQSDRFLGSSCPAVARCCFLCTCSLNQQSSSFLFSCHHNHLLTFHPDRTGTAPLCLPASSTSLPSSLRIFCVRSHFFFFFVDDLLLLHSSRSL
jgi:hypothetical protein